MSQCHITFDFLCYIVLIHSSIEDLLNYKYKCFNDNNDTFSFVIILDLTSHFNTCMKTIIMINHLRSRISFQHLNDYSYHDQSF